MSAPVIVPRAEHTISRQNIDSDALKVLYRLQQFNYTAYLVGGGVRDLLLGRRPKDFDVGTSAHPSQVKKLFRNCWIIGRRFRLAHVRYGEKTIEVATFRKNGGAEMVVPEADAHDEAAAAVIVEQHGSRRDAEARDRQREDDNTYGTPEQDAFRRDFTINALFYDIATFSIIDYVGGLQDLQEGIVRSIGDPEQRFKEDPVRMLRAVSFAARLDFRLDPPVAAALRKQRHLMAEASPARLIEEFHKILRSGSAERTFRGMVEHGLLEAVTPELQRRSNNPELWHALEALDDYRQRFDAAPPAMTNAVLIGSLLVPIGLMPKADESERSAHPFDAPDAPDAPDEDAEPAEQMSDGNRLHAAVRTGTRRRRDVRFPKPPVLKIGTLPIARRDTERLRQLLSIQKRLSDLESPARAKRALIHRGPFEEALTWLDIHGDVPEVVEHWRGFIEAMLDAGEKPRGESVVEGAGPMPHGDDPTRRRRRRRRRRFDGPKPPS